jgi:hypothetical protein
LFYEGQRVARVICRTHLRDERSSLVTNAAQFGPTTSSSRRVTLQK